ncbi:Zn-dependent oligopeptidase [Candidatus Dependentiae bacterium]|nr:Zn-dependent oligopeptidase [Candidatus Dependentiae bacterium]
MSFHERLFFTFIVAVFFSAGMYCLQFDHHQPVLQEKSIIIEVKMLKDLIRLFPTSPQEIKDWVVQSKEEIHAIIDKIITIPDDKRTFQNTVKALDDIDLTGSNIVGSAVQILEMVSPDKEIRDAAHDAVIELQAFLVEHLSNNKVLYNAFKSYADGNAKNEQLTREHRYFLDEALRDWKRAGLELPDKQLAEVKELRKELAKLASEFDRNIAEDTPIITAKKDELAGLNDAFFAGIEQSEDGAYILPLNYPVYFAIVDECTVADTRKRAYKAFVNRAYPKNKDILQCIIARRFELAHKLGFSSYAELDLASQMVGSPQRAQQFMDELLEKVQIKGRKELATILSDLPESVIPTQDGRLNPWDTRFATKQYKKKHFNIDEQEIAQYFPMEKTIEGLFEVYKKFFSIDFKQITISGLWHSDVKGVEVLDKQGNTLGYLLLDLYPRPFKFSHACHAGIIPSTYIDGKPNIPAGLVIANFSKPTEDKPALLKKDQVSTFFHEFGHALHALLGRTTLAGHAGTKVKTDFVELPSQILEEWLLDKDILKMVSSHYQTGESLPDDLIDSIIAVKNFSVGNWALAQLYYANISLTYFNGDALIDLKKCMNQLHEKVIVDTAIDPDNHFYCNFGHLTGYGAKYYGYLWSKVFAKDIFDQVKKHGLLNSEVGQKYVAAVLSKGGSKDPNELLRDFLGREPNQDAFLSDLGLR